MNQGRNRQESGKKGSKKWIQELVNRCPRVLDAHIQKECCLPPGKSISWRSPLRNDGFAEYRDECFLQLLGLQDHSQKLRQFWPKGGPQWDALGIEETAKRYFLVEAKANIPEIVSECKAESQKSIRLIESSFHRTQDFLGNNSLLPWSKGFYQYANRIAHLFFLRQIAKVDAILVFIHFENDYTHIRTSRETWQGALSLQKRLMGLSRHKLQKFVQEVFIDVKEIEGNRTFVGAGSDWPDDCS
jgi:hypothetical protein